MAIMTTGLSGVTPLASVNTADYSMTVGGETTRGILISKASGDLQRFALIVRGGGTAAAPAMTDAHIASWQKWALWGRTLFGDDNLQEEGMGYTVVVPAIRGCSAGVWTGGGASGGTDEYGGADLYDIAAAVGAGSELNVAGANPWTHSAKFAAVGGSGGAMRLLMAMAKGLVTPSVAVFAAPFIDHEAVFRDASLTSAQDAIASMIPKWESASGTLYDVLKPHEQEAIRARTPKNWVHLIPDIPMLFITGELDTTAKMEWSQDLVRAINRDHTRTHKAKFEMIPTATHAFTETGVAEARDGKIRKFLAANIG